MDLCILSVPVDQQFSELVVTQPGKVFPQIKLRHSRRGPKVSQYKAGTLCDQKGHITQGKAA